MRGEAPDPFERILSPSPTSSLPPSLPPSLSLPSVIGFLNNFSSFFLPLSAAAETLLLICPGVICLWGVPERIDRVKSRLLTPPVPKHIHSPALLTPSFLCQAADTNWHIGGGREEGGWRAGVRVAAILWTNGSVSAPCFSLMWAAPAEIWALTINELLGSSDDLHYRHSRDQRPFCCCQSPDCRVSTIQNLFVPVMAEVQILELK